jgi:hypothetical protein
MTMPTTREQAGGGLPGGAVMSESIIRSWIEQLVSGQDAAYYQYLLDHGRAFERVARKSPLLRHFRRENKTVGKGCYANSQRLASGYPSVKYYEGFRYGGVVPVNFAWNVLDDLVVEWTNWPGADSVAPVYYGVEVPIEFLKRYLGKEVVVPTAEPSPSGVSVPLRLLVGTPLLSAYLRLSPGNEGSPDGCP